MDRDLAIRPWLVACGGNLGDIGVNDAFQYRWPDALSGGRHEIPYFTYRLVRSMPVARQPGITNANALNGTEPPTVYNVVFRAQQEWIDTIEVTVYNHEYGDEVLKACSIAAQKDPDVVHALENNNAKLKQVVSLTDMTEYDAAEIHYKHVMLVDFHTQAIYRHAKTNERITVLDTDDALDL